MMENKMEMLDQTELVAKATDLLREEMVKLVKDGEWMRAAQVDMVINGLRGLVSEFEGQVKGGDEK